MFDERESNEFELTGDLNALEHRLKRLSPIALNLERDQLMFAAGRAAERAAGLGVQVKEVSYRSSLADWRGRIKAGWGWPAATAVMTAATVLLATMLVTRDREISSVPEMSAPPLVATESSPGQGAESGEEILAAETVIDRSFEPTRKGYLKTRYVALTQGIGALPVDESAGGWSGISNDATPATVRGLLQELAPQSADSI